MVNEIVTATDELPPALVSRLSKLKSKYERVKTALGPELAKEFREELNTTYKTEAVRVIIDTLMVGCTISEWVEMNNSLAMTGTLYEQAEAAIRPEIDIVLQQFLDDKLTREACIERVHWLALQAGVKDMEEFIKNFTHRLDEIKEHL